MTTNPLIVRAELPTPDMVLTCTSNGQLVLFADARLPQSAIDDAVADVDSIMEGRVYALSGPLPR